MPDMLLFDLVNRQLRETEIRVPVETETAWVPLIGAPPEEVERVLKDLFHCHPLLVEDCVKLNQRPKLDRYDHHMLLTFFHVKEDLSVVEMAHVIGPNYVVTVCREETGSLAGAADTFRQKTQLMEYSGAILYHLLDSCVDGYADVTDRVENLLDKYERAVFHNPHVRIAGEVFRLKRRLHNIRRIVSEEKTAIGQLSHQQFPYTRKETDAYFIDIYDHVSRVLDSIDLFRESITALLELQLSMKSDRMNEIMKTLTIISSIFLPLTFIAGVYGMNFRVMPELNWKYGYPAVLIVMAAVSFGLWRYYKRKKWL